MNFKLIIWSMLLVTLTYSQCSAENNNSFIGENIQIIGDALGDAIFVKGTNTGPIKIDTKTKKWEDVFAKVPDNIYIVEVIDLGGKYLYKFLDNIFLWDGLTVLPIDTDFCQGLVFSEKTQTLYYLKNMNKEIWSYSLKDKQTRRIHTEDKSIYNLTVIENKLFYCSRSIICYDLSNGIKQTISTDQLASYQYIFVDSKEKKLFSLKSYGSKINSKRYLVSYDLDNYKEETLIEIQKMTPVGFSKKFGVLIMDYYQHKLYCLTKDNKLVFLCDDLYYVFAKDQSLIVGKTNGKFYITTDFPIRTKSGK